MQLVDPDLFTKTAEADKQLAVKFFMKERIDKEATAEKGEAVYKEVEYIEIRVPGRHDVAACRPASPRDKSRFAEGYQRFLDRTQMPETGTPLKDALFMTQSFIDDLAYMNIKTVEQLANVNDNAISRLMGGYSLRDKARKWLEDNKGTVSTEQLEDKLAERDRQIDAMMAKLAEIESHRTGPTTPAPEPVEEPELEGEAESEKPARPRRKRVSKD